MHLSDHVCKGKSSSAEVEGEGESYRSLQYLHILVKRVKASFSLCFRECFLLPVQHFESEDWEPKQESSCCHPSRKLSFCIFAVGLYSIQGKEKENAHGVVHL